MILAGVASIWIAGSRNRGGCLMATVLSPGDLAIVQYNSSTTDSFSFIFARDIEAGTVVNFTDNGWLAAPADSGRAKAQSATRRPPRLPPVPSSR
jgi:hypothetical protein